MYIKNNVLYISLIETDRMISGAEKNKSKEKKEKEKRYKKWIYDWDHNSMGAIMNH